LLRYPEVLLSEWSQVAPGYGFFALCTLLAALVFAASVWLWSRRGRRGALLVPVIGAALLVATCGLVGSNGIRRDLQQVRLARQMGVSLSDPRFNPWFPLDYLMSEDVLVRGTTTREEVHEITRHATARYKCATGEAIIYYGTESDPPQTVSIEVLYDEQDRIREVRSYNDSLRLFTDGCDRF
jgi:hypothetical protein